MIIRRNRTKLTWRVVVLSFICGLTGWVSPAFPLIEIVELVWQAAAKPLLYSFPFRGNKAKLKQVGGRPAYIHEYMMHALHALIDLLNY